MKKPGTPPSESRRGLTDVPAPTQRFALAVRRPSEGRGAALVRPACRSVLAAMVAVSLIGLSVSGVAIVGVQSVGRVLTGALFAAALSSVIGRPRAGVG